MTQTDAVERLLEIQDEMLSLLTEAEDIIRRHGSNHAREASRAYWLAHVRMGLTNNHNYLGSAGYSMQDAIDSMEVCEDEDED